MRRRGNWRFLWLEPATAGAGCLKPSCWLAPTTMNRWQLRSKMCTSTTPRSGCRTTHILAAGGCAGARTSGVLVSPACLFQHKAVHLRTLYLYEHGSVGRMPRAQPSSKATACATSASSKNTPPPFRTEASAFAFACAFVSAFTFAFCSSLGGHCKAGVIWTFLRLASNSKLAFGQVFPFLPGRR